MNGAESLLRSARAAGIDVCFANPGTSEMRLVSALDRVDGMRAVLGLFEGVCTGAADGFARMSGRPALTLLHLGPGLANGIANLHNARRAHSPVVNIVGDHAAFHLAADAPLTSDIESLASSVGFVRRAVSRDGLVADLLDAIDAACAPPGGVATLIAPDDLTWGEAPVATRVATPRRGRDEVDGALVAATARALSAGSASVLFLGGAALGERGVRAAARVAAATGCSVFHETFCARLERGTPLPSLPRFPYFPEQGSAALAGARHLVLAGTTAPVAFFAYPGQPSFLQPEGCEVVTLARPQDDCERALEVLAEHVGAAPDAPRVASPQPPSRPHGPLDAVTMARAVAALQPENAIVVEEAATSGPAYFEMSRDAPRHSLLTLTGGAIGQGLPCAVGAAIACPDRRVIALQADGSAMYTLQALWTMAREGLDVSVVVCANRRYRILQIELMRAGIAEPGKKALALTDLSAPALDWVALGKGMGVPSCSVCTAEEMSDALARSLATPGPSLIEAVLE